MNKQDEMTIEVGIEMGDGAATLPARLALEVMECLGMKDGKS